VAEIEIWLSRTSNSYDEVSLGCIMRTKILMNLISNVFKLEVMIMIQDKSFNFADE
jgi:hypothetical protein